MALGGGTFTTQNKVLPGAYVNFISAARAAGTLSERGVVAFPCELNWGPEGEVFRLEPEDLTKSPIKNLGYSYTDPEMADVRDLFQNARAVYFYRLNSGGDKASCDFATAKYGGIRGNDLKVVIAKNVDDDQKYDVSLYLEDKLLDAQTVGTASELLPNDYITWKNEAQLSETAGTLLTGGTNGVVTGDSHSAALTALESYDFHVLGSKTTDVATKSLYVAYTKRMRDSVGVKFSTVLVNTEADYEGIINVKDQFAVIPWVSGAQAACGINKSLTNAAYTGEAAVTGEYSQAQLEKSILAGEFVFHKVNDEYRILKDINSLVSASEEKGEVFKNNQSIRVMDQIAIDIASLFNERYLGRIQNNKAGRMSLWSDIVSHHQELERLGAIEKFVKDDLVVSEGTDKGSVIVEDAVTIINAMDKLYMTVSIS